MRQQITLRGKTVGEGQPLFIVAECGVTCNYDMAVAKALIDVVHESGADAIKFIFWFPDEIMSDRTIQYAYDTVDGPRSENMYEMLSALRFSLDQWHELKAYADARGVVMFCTVNSPSGIEFAETIGLEAYKLSSWDFNYLPLWRRIAAIGKPMLIDTGPVTSTEVGAVLRVMQDEGNDQSVLIHCFHTSVPGEMNMRAIPYMRDTFESIVGFSSTDQRDETDFMALTLGAHVIEKRLTLDRRLPGHHHVLSKEPKEFAQYVATMRDAAAALGVRDLRPSAGDLAERKKWFRHLVANQDIPAGTVLTADMLEGKRPEQGVSPEHLEAFVGRRTRRALRYNEAIAWSDV
jgi:sialic acid synthase SpsE